MLAIQFDKPLLELMQFIGRFSHLLAVQRDCCPPPDAGCLDLSRTRAWVEISFPTVSQGVAAADCDSFSLRAGPLFLTSGTSRSRCADSAGVGDVVRGSYGTIGLSLIWRRNANRAGFR